MFKALVVSESDGSVTSEIKQLEESDLPEGDLTIRVEKSTLNYKDGMVVKGIGKLVKTYPHVPGVDMAGEVVESKNPAFREGDGVLVTGFRVGETYWGGYSQLARVNSNFALKLPNGLGSHDAMAIGTASQTDCRHRSVALKLRNHPCKGESSNGVDTSTPPLRLERSLAR